MIRVVEKIFKELKDYKQEMLENVDEKLAGSNKMSMKDITNTFFQVWKEKVEWILRKRMEEKKETKCFIYDFIRAKCMFDSV